MTIAAAPLPAVLPPRERRARGAALSLAPVLARGLLHGVDFTALPGEVTAIVGPNGSGKTTLLRALTRDVPASGRVVMNGQDIARLSPRAAAAWWR